MKSKQLANVLIKMIGLSLCVHSGISIILALFTLSNFTKAAAAGWIYPLTSIVIGVLLIVRSQEIAQLLFKNEEE